MTINMNDVQFFSRRKLQSKQQFDIKTTWYMERNSRSKLVQINLGFLREVGNSNNNNIANENK